jgi:hypothetical protein
VASNCAAKNDDQDCAAARSELDVSNLRRNFRDGTPVCDIAGFLLRTEDDVQGKARDLGIALGVS